ncbi:MAG: adenylate kinase [Myxococcota bacterium]|nr:adenylate kinase [Myxococcota bacterium]
MDRIAIVGSSGAGKSTLARRLQRERGHAWLELDALHHLPGWRPRPEAETRARIAAFLERERRWVIDGNYAAHRAQIWSAADAVVWLDLPRHQVMRALLGRTLRRTLTREPLYNGNREPWSNLTSLDPERSVLAWSFTRFHAYRATYLAAMVDPTWAHLRFVRLRSRREVERLLETWPAPST